MLSDEATQASLEITKDGAIIATEVVKVLFPAIAKLTGAFFKSIGKGTASFVKKEWNKFKNRNVVAGGEVSVHELGQNGEKVMPVQLDKDKYEMDKFIRNNLKKRMEEAGVFYAVTEDKDNYTLFFKESDAYKVNPILASWEIDSTEYLSVAALYGKEEAQKINYELVDMMSPEDKQKIKDNWNQSLKAAFTKDFTTANPIVEEAWRQSEFKGQDKNVFKTVEAEQKMAEGMSRQDFFISKLKEAIPENEHAERICIYPGKNIIYIDDNNTLHNIAIGSGKHYSVKCENPEEAKEAFVKTNENLTKFEKDMETKYTSARGYDDVQRSFLRQCQIEKMINPAMDFTYYDKAEYSVSKMAALHECQKVLSEDNFAKVMEHADRLPEDTIWGLSTLNENKYPNMDIGSLIDRNFTQEEINALKEIVSVDGYKEMYDTPELNQVFEGVFQKTETVHGEKIVTPINTEGIHEKMITQAADATHDIAQKQEALKSATPENQEKIKAEIEKLTQTKEQAEEWLKSETFYKQIQEKKAEAKPLQEHFNQALENRVQEQIKVETMGLDNVQTQNLDMNEVMMERNTYIVDRDYYREFGAIDEILSFDNWQDEIDPQQWMHEKDFSFKLDRQGNVAVEAKGMPLTMTDDFLYKWDKSKKAFERDGKEYKQMMSNGKGKVYVSRNGDTIVRRSKPLTQTEVAEARRTYHVHLKQQEHDRNYKHNQSKKM
ncbi:MAG: hypothetical protein J6J86_04790 [Lachnospiraceae bacterium]|nr:hypothetical protein [Lachnospiraceae bacterium]